MLISFSVENFKSIRERVRLDLTPNASVKDEDLSLINTDNPDIPQLLRVLAIYGTNGSGKSTLLRAANLTRRLILTSAKENTLGDPIPVEAFLLDKVSFAKPTTFSSEFIIGGIRHMYEFSVTHERVHHEVLHVYPNRTKQVWFERKYLPEKNDYEWRFSSHFRGDKLTTREMTLQNTLYLSKAVMNNDQQLIGISEFFRKKFFVTYTHHDPQYTNDYLKTDLGRERVLSFLRNADLGIDDVIIKKHETLENTEARFMPYIQYDTRIVRRIPGTEEFVSFNLEKSESTGTIKMFRMAGLIMNALSSGGVLLVDELEHGLHIKLQYYLIELFNNPLRNPFGAQLIFTTHAPLILEQNSLRRDQIWFAAKTEKKNTILYSLVDVAKNVKDAKPVRKGQDLVRSFLRGRFYEPPRVFQEQLSFFSDDDD